MRDWLWWHIMIILLALDVAKKILSNRKTTSRCYCVLKKNCNIWVKRWRELLVLIEAVREHHQKHWIKTIWDEFTLRTKSTFNFQLLEFSIKKKKILKLIKAYHGPPLSGDRGYRFLCQHLVFVSFWYIIRN